MSCSNCTGGKKKETFFSGTPWRVIAISSGTVLLVMSYLFWGSIEHSLMHRLWFIILNPAWIVIAVCGLPLFRTAFTSLFKRKKIVSALLITTAVAACVALEIYGWFMPHYGDAHSHSYLFAAGEIALLMFLGEAIEDFTVKRSNRGIERLLSLAPTKAFVRISGEFTELPIDFVQTGDTVLVKPNSIISIDGIVSKGNTSVVEAAVTGESVPVDKAEGSTVFAGTTNLNGAVEITVTKVGSESTVAKMIKLVEEAEHKKAPIASLADRWAGIIVPAAITLCVLVTLFAALMLQTGWNEAIVRGVTILVVFCPCSLALATPTAVAAGIGNASGHGIIIKSGLALETLAKTNVACFDKTGTLTTADIEVYGFKTSINEKEFKALAGSAEAFSEHPVSKAVTKAFGADYAASDTQSMVGAGVSAIIEGKRVVVAKYDYFENTDIYKENAEEWFKEGCTVIGVGVEGRLVGVIALKDAVRETAAHAIEEMNTLGYDTVMLTGDNEQSAASVAKALRVDKFRARLLPEDKVKEVEALKRGGKRVLMVGDGINDAPSLAAADVSMAMGVMGNTVAMDVADMSIMNNNLSKIPYAVRLARKTLSTIKRNIVISMSINLAAVILSAAGILNPVLGAIIHNCSSVFVVASSAVLLLAKPVR